MRQAKPLSYCLKVTVGTGEEAFAPAHGPLNIIHVVVDDLRPELGAYGVQGRHTPHIDSLARGGVTFDAAFTQYAVCGPSRNSFMSGRRPDASRCWNFINHFREDHPDWTSLPGMFLRAGRNSYGVGKLYHPFLPPNNDGAKSWSQAALPYANPCYFEGVSCLPCEGVTPKCADDGFGPGNPATCWCMVEAVEDAEVTTHAMKYLDEAAADYLAHGTTFYLGVGLHKPHLAKKEFFDLYPLENITVAKHKLAPEGMPPIAFHATDEDSPYTSVADSDAKLARRAYYAATSGMDSQVGRLLAHLADQDLAVQNSTVVLLHGDHGWQLGEHAEWHKMTNFEVATRVPFIVRPPPGWLPPHRVGARSAGLVELVDLMPTMAAMANISSPVAPGETPLGGASLVPLLLGAEPQPKAGAFSQYARRVKNASAAWRNNGVIHANRTAFTHMGYSVRTGEWRYTEWREWDNRTLTADWSTRGLAATELYDHRNESAFPTDFDRAENFNWAANASVARPFLDLIANLSAQLRRQFAPTAAQ